MGDIAALPGPKSCQILEYDQQERTSKKANVGEDVEAAQASLI